MAFPYELAIGLRYAFSSKGQGRDVVVSIISFFSSAGIALGVAALIVVLSVMNGFQKELRTRILSVASHIEIRSYYVPLTDWQSVEANARKYPHVIAAAPYVQGQAMLTFDGASQGALIRGVLPAAEETVSDLEQHMVMGSINNLKPGGFGIVIGKELARMLGVTLDDSVVVMIPQGTATPAGTLPRLRTFKIVGLFNFDMSEYDTGLTFIHMEDAQRLYRMGQGVTGVRLKLDDLMLAQQLRAEIGETLPPPLRARDWTQSHANFFRAVQIEKRMMFLILVLIIIVATFNIISAQVMAVTEKRADIAILRTLGASPGSILSIFIFQGAMVGVVGTLIGVIGGCALAINVQEVVGWIEGLFNMKFLDKNVYYISELPSDLHIEDVSIIAGTALFFALVATLYPAWKAAHVNPATALRYE